MNKKYELTDDIKMFGPIKLYRIKALKSFGDVKEGDIGGYIQSEENLSHEGDCWVYDEAVVRGEAKAYEDAKISNNARVSERAKVYGRAKIYGEAAIFDEAKAFGESSISDNAKVCGEAKMFDGAKAYQHAIIKGNSEIKGDASVFGSAKVSGNAKVFEGAIVHGLAIITDYAQVFGIANISGCVCLNSNAKACGIGVGIDGFHIFSKDAIIKSTHDMYSVSGIGRHNRLTTFYRTETDAGKGVGVSCGCFTGTLEEFRERVIKEHGDSIYAKEYLLAIEIAKLKFSQYKSEKKGEES